MDQAQVGSLIEHVRRLERENAALKRRAGQINRAWGLALLGALVLCTGATQLRPMAAGEDRVPRIPDDVFAGIPLVPHDRPDPNDLPPFPWTSSQSPSEIEFWEAFVKARFERIVFLIEKVGEKSEPCMDVPLIGPVRRVSGRFKCTVHFGERIGGVVKNDAVVVYGEKVRLDRCDQAGHGLPTGRKPRNPSNYRRNLP